MSKAPPSVETRIRQHRKARVLVASQKPMLTRMDPMTDQDVINQMVRQYG